MQAHRTIYYHNTHQSAASSSSPWPNRRPASSARSRGTAPTSRSSSSARPSCRPWQDAPSKWRPKDHRGPAAQRARRTCGSGRTSWRPPRPAARTPSPPSPSDAARTCSAAGVPRPTLVHTPLALASRGHVVADLLLLAQGRLGANEEGARADIAGEARHRRESHGGRHPPP